MFTLKDGSQHTLYIVDAFVQTWVRTPCATDVLHDAVRCSPCLFLVMVLIHLFRFQFNDMWGNGGTDNKDDVIRDFTWAFTGNKLAQLVPPLPLMSHTLTWLVIRSTQVRLQSMKEQIRFMEATFIQLLIYVTPSFGGFSFRGSIYRLSSFDGLFSRDAGPLFTCYLQLTWLDAI